MRTCIFLVLAAGLCLVLAGGTLKAASDKTPIPYPEAQRMTKEALKEMMGKPGVVVLDCRPEEQWNESEHKIPGAVHEDPFDVKSWAGKYAKDTPVLVTY